jgi:pimeloyl-ACP methyl ester carboxylesterase
MGHSIRRFIALTLTLAIAVPVVAQERPTVFVHGLNGSPGTWQPAAERLTSVLNISPYVPAVPWADHFETQVGSLQTQLGMLPSSTIAIGHSNGGIVARAWSAQRPLSGVLTVGSPQQGAPIVNKVLTALNFHGQLYGAAGAAFGAFGLQPNQWWSVYAYVELALALTQQWSWGAYFRILGLGLLTGHPVIPQMAVGSTFLSGLNSSQSQAREAATIAGRAGLVYSLDRYWQAGPIRLFDPTAADQWYPRIWAAVAVLEAAGSYLAFSYPGNVQAQWIASELFRVASGLRQIDPLWCWAVTDDVSCNTPHDGIVPVTRQVYPGANNLYIHGPSHLQEATVSDSAIQYALSTYMQVSTRSGGGDGGGTGGGGGGGGGSNQSDELGPGESLRPGEGRTSSNGEYTLWYQGDGNLVLYRNSDGRPLWATATPGPAGEAAMQGDGNLVVYSSSWQPQWSSGTAGHEGARLAVQSDGNLVVYDAYGYPLWWRQ